jgi:hypothetical protein
VRRFDLDMARTRLPLSDHDMPVSAGSFRHEGQRLAYTEYGEGPRVVVLLHGLLVSQRIRHRARGRHPVSHTRCQA